VKPRGVPLRLPTTGVHMAYMVHDRQYTAVAVGARGTPAELPTLAIPERDPCFTWLANEILSRVQHAGVHRPTGCRIDFVCPGGLSRH
jgi:hypothetical protein